MSAQADLYPVLCEATRECWGHIIYKQAEIVPFTFSNNHTVPMPLYDCAEIADKGIAQLVGEDTLCPGCLMWHEPEHIDWIECSSGLEYNIYHCKEANVYFGVDW